MENSHINFDGKQIVKYTCMCNTILRANLIFIKKCFIAWLALIFETLNFGAVRIL